MSLKAYERYLIYALFLGVAGLYILYFTSHSEATVESELQDSLDSLSKDALIPAHNRGAIYYVNTDSVWDNYDYVEDIFNQLESKKSQYESQIDKKVRAFEREYMSLQEKARGMSEMELKIKQNDLMKQESELTKLKENLEMRFMKEEKELNDILRADIIGYIEDYTSEKDYDYILGYSITSNIILANDSLDLTTEVLEGLNNRYRMKNSAGK